MILFEILIALTLTAALLTFLFSFFAESAKIEKKLHTARMAANNRAHLQTRLQTILSAMGGLSSKTFYTKQFGKEKNMSLVVIFDNGIDPDPAFSGAITGRIFIDSENNLSLATWPLDKNKNRPWRKEVLLPHVKNMEFAFLGPREGKKEEIIQPINTTLAWRSTWPKSQADAPSTIRLSIQEKNQKDPIRFAFILPIPETIPYMEKTL